MAVTNLVIAYDIQPPVYFPGKPVSGKISFLVTEPLPFDNVRVECYGAANTKRTKTATSASGFTKNIVFSAGEICCDLGKTILEGQKSHAANDQHGKIDGTSQTLETDRGEMEKSVSIARKTSALKPASTSVIKPGTYFFPFTFFLPLKCPSSFEGSYGQVRYFCKVIIASGGTVRFAQKEAFTVVGWTDLNLSPAASFYYQTEAHSSTDEKGGKILVRLYLRQQGFVPGEMINARMEIVNNSAKAITAIFAQFVQKVTYAAKRQNADDWSKWEERKVMQQATKKEKVASKKSSLLKWEVFTVPPCCPTMLVDANIVRVQYEVQFHFVFDANVPGLLLAAPIVVGAIPLKHSFDELCTVVRRRQSDGNVQPSPYMPFMERYPDIPLSTYAPQLAEPVDIRESCDLAFMPEAIQFLPMAVVYDSSKSTDNADDNKRSSRKEGKEEKRPRSRSTLSRFSFRGSSDNIAASKESLDENGKKSDKKKQQQEVKEANKAKTETSRRWGKKKTVTIEPETAVSKTEPSGKSKKGKTDKKQVSVQHKGTQEPPIENGALTEPEDTSGGEEEFF